MKKVLLGVFLATGLLTYAQQIQDLPLFGLEQRTGTARFQAMAGAFGALGEISLRLPLILQGLPYSSTVKWALDSLIFRQKTTPN